VVALPESGVALAPLAHASQGRSALLASELAVPQAGPLVSRCCPGRQADDRSSRPVVPDPEVCLAARPAPAAQLGWLPPRSDQRQPRLPDRLALQVGFQAGAAAVPGYQPAAQPEELNRAEWSTLSPHLVMLAPAA
jgi:hypothetical protein